MLFPPPLHFCYVSVCPDGRHIEMQEPWQRRAIRHPEAVSKEKKKMNMNKLLNGIAGYVTEDPSSLLQLEGEQEAGSKNLTSGAIEAHLEKKPCV